MLSPHRLAAVQAGALPLTALLLPPAAHALAPLFRPSADGRASSERAEAERDTRARIAARLGVDDPTASNETIFAALDEALAKPTLTEADRVYNLAWGEAPTARRPELSTAEAALYRAAFGEGE